MHIRFDPFIDIRKGLYRIGIGPHCLERGIYFGRGIWRISLPGLWISKGYI